MVNLKKQVDKFREITGLIAKSLKGWHCAQRALSVVLSVALVLAFMPKTAFGEDGYTVDSGGNWTITTAAGLVALANKVNSGENSFEGKTVILDSDIDLSPIYTAENPYWEPIGTIYSKSFRGSFDGGDHTISNLHLNGENNNTGLFGYIYNGTVENVTLDNVTCTEGTGEYIGGICGYCSGTISNCVVNGTITGGEYIGGICGYRASDSTISDCLVKGTITGGEYIGGICGHFYRGNISRCIVSDSIISGKEKVGGICGETSDGADKISRCAVSKTTISATNLVGGICGRLYGVHIEECFSNADISGQIGVGGVCGGVSFGAGGKWSGISGCYFTGTLTGESEIGGIVGTSLYSSFDDHI